MKRRKQRRTIYLLLLMTCLLIVPEILLSAQGNSNGRGRGGRGDGRDGDKVTICHVSGDPDDPSSYNTITISENGLSGHFEEDGSPRESHQYDTMGPCDVGDIDDDGDEERDDDDDAITRLDEDFEPISVGAPTCTNWLVFHTDRTGDWEVFRLDATSNSTINLTRGEGANDYGPAISPDRQWIVFTSNRDGNRELYLARTDGSEVQRVTDSPGSENDAIWAPNSAEVLYQVAHDGQTDLWMVDLARGELFLLVADGSNNVNPSMSPDGSRMVYVSDRDGAPNIYEYSFETGETRRLTAGSGVYTNPQYNASGNSIAYRADLGNGSAVIQIMEANGQNAQTISDPASDIGNHAWSPDGGAIAYESNRSGNLDIYVYFVGNQRTRQLTSNSVPDYGATWYCNTLTLVFTSNATGDPNLFAASALPTDGAPIAVQPGINQLTTEPSRDLYPVQTPPEENATVEDLAG